MNMVEIWAFMKIAGMIASAAVVVGIFGLYGAILIKMELKIRKENREVKRK